MARQEKFNAVEKGVDEKGAYYNRHATRMGTASSSSRADKLNNQEIKAQLQGLKELYQPKLHPSVQQQDKSTLFGQFLSCIDRRYILTQQDNNLYIIDIYKALPMIFTTLFEPGKSKTLLIPQSVSMDPLKLEQLLINQSLLSQWGMEISQLGPDTSLFRSLPATAFLTHCEIIPELFLKSWQDVMPAAPLEENQQDEFYKLFINSIKSALTLSSLETVHLMQFVQQLERAVEHLEQHPESIQSKDQNAWTVIDAQKIKALFNTHS
jgi:DNA mismatch repair ATPase MutL